MRDLREAVAGNAKPQAEAAVAEGFVLALVNKSVVDATAGPPHVRLLE